MQPNSHMLQKPELRHADVCTFSQIMKIKAIALGAKTSQERLKKKCALTLTQKSLISLIQSALCFMSFGFQFHPLKTQLCKHTRKTHTCIKVALFIVIGPWSMHGRDICSTLCVSVCVQTDGLL